MPKSSESAQTSCLSFKTHEEAFTRLSTALQQYPDSGMTSEIQAGAYPQAASMPPKVSRSRSNTAASNASSRQSKSRASTTSDQSVGSHSSHHRQHASESSFQVQPQPESAVFRDTPEEVIARSAHQLTNPNNHYAIDPSLQTNASLVTEYHPESGFDHDSCETRPQLHQFQSYDSRETAAYDIPNEDQGHDGNVGGDGSRRKKGSATSQANDNELRKLYRENDGRPLEEVAAQVIENERGPKSEKTKQIFAMLWLSSHCKKSSSSVPRNRVFSHYATRCGTERVPPLNPASFGKLVRIIFPGIQTRRLGVRGESKYHYVELSLHEDQQASLDAQRAQSTIVAGYGPRQVVERRDSGIQRPQLPADTALFPSSAAHLVNDLPLNACRHGAMDYSCLYLAFPANNAPQAPSRTNMLHRELKFPTSEVSNFPDNELLELPSIDPYLPAGADADAVRSLTSVYRSHCNLAIENFRFCKKKDFWQSYSSLLGLLTVPGQKLLAHPKIAAWIKSCDWLKYQKMMSIVQILALTKNHPKATRHMENVATELCSFISTSFQNQPQHVQDAMLGPATIFVSLLKRMFNVNNAAQAAAEILINDAGREEMWNEWMSHVKPPQIVQSALFGYGYTRVLHILTQEIRDLLSPLYSNTSFGIGTIFETTSAQSASNPYQHSHPGMDTQSTENHLDRWVHFLHSLPSRFPGLEARLLLNFIDVIGNAALRDLSRGAAPSLSGWWTVKMFIDETSHWLAEKGGFLENGPESMTMRAEPSRGLATAASAAFGLDERSDMFGGPRPGTGASTSMEGPSRFSSVDVSHDFSRPVRDHGGNADVGIGYRQEDGDGNGENADTDHDFGCEGSRRGSVVQQTKHEEEQQHSRRGSTVMETTVETSMFHAGDMGHVPNHDDSGIGLGLEDDEFATGKYSGFVQDGIHGSDPADVVVC